MAIRLGPSLNLVTDGIDFRRRHFGPGSGRHPGSAEVCHRRGWRGTQSTDRDPIAD